MSRLRKPLGAQQRASRRSGTIVRLTWYDRVMWEVLDFVADCLS